MPARLAQHISCDGERPRSDEIFTVNEQSSGTLGQKTRPQRGRIYPFFVIALATFVAGLTIGPQVTAPVTAHFRASTTEPTDNNRAEWSKASLLTLFAAAAIAGIAGSWLVRRGDRARQDASHLAPQQVEQVTGLPVVGMLFPVSAPPKSPVSWRWLVVPAEFVLMMAVMLSFHAAVTQPAMARQFARNPFSAYAAHGSRLA